MKRLLNQPERYVTEMLEGIYAAHTGELTCVGGDVKCLVNAKKQPGKVAICTGGGSGHLPLFLGYVGDGLLDGCCVGEVFQSPSSMQIYQTTKHIDSGTGVLYLYGNYSGDILNFDMAREMAEMDQIQVRQVVAGDDVASAPKDKAHIRRGVAGIFYAYKCAGAAAAAGMNLDEVARIAAKACANVRTMGMALSPCIIPEIGQPSFQIEAGQMEIGMGIHGEPGIRVEALASADQIVDEMLPMILADLPYESGDEVSVLVNGLGATPKEDLYVVFRRISEILAQKGIRVFHTYVGEYATAMEMAGMSISLFKLDEELKTLLAKPACTPFFAQPQLDLTPPAAAVNAARLNPDEEDVFVGFGEAPLAGKMNAAGFAAFIARASALMDEHKQELIALDANLGDGDLGLTMSKGFAKASAFAKLGTKEELAKFIMKTGMVFAKEVPSTMGTLMASGFMKGGKAVSGKKALAADDVAEFAAGFAAGIMERGRAKVGECTIVDALYPAGEAFRKAAAAGASLKAAAKQAYEAAVAGMEATKAMTPCYGKSAVFADKAQGIVDQGAVVGTLLYQALYESLI